MYYPDPLDPKSDEWYIQQSKRVHEKAIENKEKYHLYKGFVNSKAYQDVKEDIFTKFIYRTPNISISSVGPIEAFGHHLKQQGIRLFFDTVEGIVNSVKSD